MGVARLLPARAGAGNALYAAALGSTLLGVLYLAGLVGKLVVDGTVHSVSSPGVQRISAIVALLWDISLLILFAALRRQAPARRSLQADLALVFMSLVCATSSVAWFLQLSALPRGADPALFDIHNELSVPFAMEHLGWGLFYGIAALFAAASVRFSPFSAWIRGLFVTSGILSILHFTGVIASSGILFDAGYIAWGLALPLTTALIALDARGAGV